MKRKILAVVLPLAASSVSFAESNNATGFEYSGYLRASMSTTSQGGEQYCFGDGAYGYHVGRLGNECDSYGELGLANTWKSESGAIIKANTMLSVSTQQGAQGNDYQSISEPALPVTEYGAAEIALRQMNVTATNVFASMPEATVWAGKRFYKRKGVETMDLYYLNNSGYGAGIQDIKLGYGDLSVALVNVQREQLMGRNNVHGHRSVQNNVLDVRLDNIDFVGKQKLDLSVVLSKSDRTDLQQQFNEPNDSGSMVTVEMHGDVMGANNRLVVQYGEEALGQAAFESQSGIAPETTPWWEGSIESAWRFINFGDYAVNDKIDLGYVFYATQAETIASNVPNDAPYHRSMILSPSYKWDNNQRTVLEVGVSRYQPIQNIEVVDLQKVVLAHELTFDLGMKHEPVLRAYTGMFFGNAAEVQRTGSRDGEDGNLVFGIQAVANW